MINMVRTPDTGPCHYDMMEQRDQINRYFHFSEGNEQRAWYYKAWIYNSVLGLIGTLLNSYVLYIFVRHGEILIVSYM